MPKTLDKDYLSARLGRVKHDTLAFPTPERNFPPIAYSADHQIYEQSELVLAAQRSRNYLAKDAPLNANANGKTIYHSAMIKSRTFQLLSYGMTQQNTEDTDYDNP
jgi:hypothetical protein